METLQAIRKRKSTRSFKPDVISEEQLNTVLAAGCAAPVGMAKYDDIQITVIQKDDTLKTISAAIGKIFQTDKDMLYGAPTLVLLSAKEDIVPGMNAINVGCILENMALAATDLGLDCCILGGPPAVINPSPEIKGALDLPDGYNAIGSIALGFATKPVDSEKDLKIKISTNRI